MSIRHLVEQARTCRRFRQEVPLSRETLLGLVDCARLMSSAHNSQHLRYHLSWEPERNARIFPHLKWAALMPAWGGPVDGERPSAYLVLLAPESRAGWKMLHYDVGIAAQTIKLAAAEQGLASCMLCAVDFDGLHAELGLSADLQGVMVIALGQPGETVVLDTVGEGGDTRYWRDGAGVHHVPKRRLDELIIT